MSIRRLRWGGILLRRLNFTSEIKVLIRLQNYIIFSVYSISVNNLIPIQTLISLSTLIKMSMLIISTAVLIWFQRSILRTWKKLNSFQLFPTLARLQVFLIFMQCLLKNNSQRSYLIRDQSLGIQSPDEDRVFVFPAGLLLGPLSWTPICVYQSWPPVCVYQPRLKFVFTKPGSQCVFTYTYWKKFIYRPWSINCIYQTWLWPWPPICIYQSRSRFDYHHSY